jgi:NTE family protein
VQATDFANEEPFVFGQDTFVWICSDITTLPMARAVAASNGFPVLFTPISLRNYAHDDEHACKRPAWVDPYLAIPDELSRRRQLALLASSYLDKREEAYVHLLDGGVSDNLGLRGLMQMLAPTAEEATLDAESLNKLRHVLIVSVDGQAEPDRKMTEVPYLDSVFRVIGAVTSTAIDRYGFETLIHAREMTRRLAQGLARRDCPRGENGPTACRMIDDHFVHLSLSDIAEDEGAVPSPAIRRG